MQCAYCKETIDDDSKYCDLCGEEIKFCPSCHKTGKGKVCTSCGTTLVLVREATPGSSTDQAPSSSPAAETSGVNPVPPPPLHSASPPQSDAQTGGTVRLDNGQNVASSAPPELRLLNKNLNIDLRIYNNSLLGRITGNYVATFGSYSQVSGKHCRFSFDLEKGWFVTDLGSTNGTALNNALLLPNMPQSLQDKMFLKIANIEFYVQIM